MRQRTISWNAAIRDMRNERLRHETPLGRANAKINDALSILKDAEKHSGVIPMDRLRGLIAKLEAHQ